jgi:hypothetical protein
MPWKIGSFQNLLINFRSDIAGYEAGTEPLALE